MGRSTPPGVERGEGTQSEADSMNSRPGRKVLDGLYRIISVYLIVGYSIKVDHESVFYSQD